jgi:hypothetical protein
MGWPSFRKGFATKFPGISSKDGPADPLDRDCPYLPVSGNALQQLPKPFVGGQLADLYPAGAGQLPKRRLERSGVHARARIGQPQRCHPLLAGDWVLTCE